MQNTSEQLFDLLSTKDYKITTLDGQSKKEIDPEKYVMFSFDFTDNGKNYGPVVILLNKDNDMEIFFGDVIGKTMDRTAKKQWTELLYQLRMFSKRNMMGYKIENINRLKYSLQSMSKVNECFKRLFESYYGTSRTSYNPQGKAKIIIKHSKAIGENDKRYRSISTIFIENDSGERFKLPFKKLTGARAMARHVTEGGNPYDLFGLHISETVENINILGGFVRRSKMFTEDESTLDLVETGRTHYDSMRKGLKQIAGKRGYNMYKESWVPSNITETEQDVNQIRQLFTRESINQKVENAIPLLARLSAGKPEVISEKEVLEFEQWADNLISDNTLNEEDLDKISVEELTDWFQIEQPFGMDGLNATNSLYNIIDDDDLMGELEVEGSKNPESDARDTVHEWLLWHNPEIVHSIQYKPEEVTEVKDLDDDHICQTHDDDDKITNKGNGMDTFNDYVEEEEEDKEDAPKKVQVTEDIQQPTYDDDFESLIQRTNYLLQK